MSSAYRILCLSHDPAIDASPDASSLGAAWYAYVEARHAHPHCDLVIGRYSYPLVEVFCPTNSGGSHVHSVTMSIDARWLRLLLAASTAAPGTALALAIEGLPRCWTIERVKRLAIELDGPVDLGSPPSTATPRVAGVPQHRPADQAWLGVEGV